ncbi:MAG: YlxR family protein [Clostridia bacterium]|nr:YlxR family protein [Clostridia bacterium]
MSNNPLRMCVACREMKEKTQLLKVVKNKNGTIEIDEHSKKEGRGAYLCKNSECLNLCIKKKCFNRSFKSNISEDIYNKIKEYIN